MLDVLIYGGRILDGTGSPWHHGAVGVEGDRVSILRSEAASTEAKRTIDATGLVVCPGFIDAHTHSDLMALNQPRNEAKVHQGVTTEVIGVDGNSYAPFPSYAEFQRFLKLNAGIDGSPPLPRRWSTVAEYLALFDGKAACNYVYFIGNSALRIATVGWEDRPASKEEVEMQKALLRKGMEEGAFGLSTGLTYPPGSYADTRELAELCKEVRRLGGVYVTHMRYFLGDQFLDPFKEAVDIGRASGAPVHISHLHSPRPGGVLKLLELVDEAREAGVDVTFDAYPYPYSSSRLEAVLPDWAHSGGIERLQELMRSMKGRKQIGEALAARAPSWDAMMVTNFSKPHNRRWDGMPVAGIAQGLNKSITDTICDLLLEEELALSYTALGGNPANIREAFRHPAGMVGSDGVLVGERLNPRSYGTFPMVLGDLVREERVLELSEAVRKMTSFPAQRFGLPDRGVLRDGMKADIVVFDPKKVGSKATLEEPAKLPDGVPYVLVNGQVVVDKGRHTGALPGVALRHKAGSA